MANSGVFPIYIRSEYKSDGKGLAAFRSDAARAAAAAKAEFEGVGKALDAALSRGRTSGGALDLGVDELRRAAQEQQRLAAAAREVAEASRRAATATGSFDSSLSRSTRAAFEFAAAQERSSRDMLEQIALLDRIQGELNQTASATNAATAAGRRSAAVSGQQRQGLQQLSFQLNDVATQFALGAKPAQIFAAQSGQVIQAVQMMTGGTSRLAAFLGGPWGLALTSAAIVATPFIGKLLEGEKSADQLREALDKVNFVTNATANAQSVLGNVLDLTTGKLKDQAAATLTLARAQLQIQLVQARLAGKQAEQTLRAAGARSVEVGTERRVTGDRTGSIAIPIRRPTVSAAEAQRALGGDTEGALQQLLRLQEAGKITLETFGELSEAIGNLGVSKANTKVLEDALKALDGDRGALGQFLKPSKGSRDSGAAEARRAAREVERLATFGEQAAEQVARINAQFDAQPRLIDQAAQATRQLDALIAELGKRKPAGFKELIADAERARATVQTALVEPFEQLRRESEQRLQIETLLAQGREAEAAALQDVLRLERQIGTVTEEQRAEIEAINRAEAERIRYLRDQQRLFLAQLDAVDAVQRSLTDLLSGRSSNFFGDFKQALLDLQGARLFEDLFGKAFRQIRDDLQQNTPQGRANAAYAEQVNRTATATQTLGSEVTRLAGTIRAANDDIAGLPRTYDPRAAMVAAGLSRVGIDPFGITVPGVRPRDEFGIKRTSVIDLANRISASIAEGITGPLSDVLGDRFAEALGKTIGGFIAGKALGGTPGGIVNALAGLTSGIKGFEKLSKDLGKLLEGAAFGTQVASISKALGLGGSTTGAQIGGIGGQALGTIIGGPAGGAIGKVIGSIGGSLLGGLFKKTPRGSANLTGVDQFTLSGNNRGGAQDSAAGLAGEVSDALRNIARQLGAQLGSFSTSIGISGDSFHVDPTGRGRLKKSQGGIDFNQDRAAAIAFAIGDAIADGAIRGLSAAEMRLLRANKDVEAALRDVLDFQSIGKRLRALKDPIGAAIDEVTSEFDRYRELFRKAGADAAQLAQLEELAGIERARAIQEATDRVAGSLKNLLDSLRFGDSGLSLRDRQSNAQSRFDALAARVAAGDTSAFDDFAEISQQLLDIERQLFGSTQAYFDRLNQVTTLTERAIAGSTNVVSIGGQATAAAEQQAVQRAVNQQTNELASRLDLINANLIALAPGVQAVRGGGAGTGFSPAFSVGRVANF